MRAIISVFIFLFAVTAVAATDYECQGEAGDLRFTLTKNQISRVFSPEEGWIEWSTSPFPQKDGSLKNHFYLPMANDGYAIYTITYSDELVLSAAAEGVAADRIGSTILSDPQCWPMRVDLR